MLRLAIADGQGARPRRLGADLASGEALQAVVPARAWQEAETLGAGRGSAASRVGCVVAPAFDLAGFAMAAPEWRP